GRGNRNPHPRRAKREGGNCDHDSHVLTQGAHLATAARDCSGTTGRYSLDYFKRSNKRLKNRSACGDGGFLSALPSHQPSSLTTGPPRLKLKTPTSIFGSPCHTPF